jgi:hypothetical protein
VKDRKEISGIRKKISDDRTDRTKDNLKRRDGDAAETDQRDFLVSRTKAVLTGPGTYDSSFNLL